MSTVGANDTVTTNATVFTNDAVFTNESTFGNDAVFGNDTEFTNETNFINDVISSKNNTVTNDTVFVNETDFVNDIVLSNNTVFTNDTFFTNETLFTNFSDSFFINDTIFTTDSIFTNNESFIFNSTSASPTTNFTDAWLDSGSNAGGSASGQLYRAPLWQTDFPVAVVYCCLTLFIIVVGTFGNTAIIVINVMDRDINNIGRIFIINIAIGDLCVSSFAEPVCIVGVYYGEAWFDNYWFLCEAVAILCFIACIGSYLSFVLRAINRYIFLCRKVVYYDIYTTKRAIIACVICWIIAAIVDSANLVGWGDHSFDRKSHRCVWDRGESFSYTMTIGVVLLTPLPVTIGCFICIFKEIYMRKKAICYFEKDSLKESLRRRVLKEALKSARNLLVGFIVFLVLWAPAGFLVLIDFADTISMQAYLFTVMLAHFHSCADFLINMVIDGKFRRKLYLLLTTGKIRTVKPRNNHKNMAIKTISNQSSKCTSSSKPETIESTDSTQHGDNISTQNKI